MKVNIIIEKNRKKKRKKEVIKMEYYLCFLVDQKREMRRHRPVAGMCSRCGAAASVADMKMATRFCFVPFYFKSWKAIICTFCGATLKSYA